MATIAEIRQQYPQYDHLSDQELADKLYATHYADKIDRDTFNQKIGLSSATPSSQSPIPDFNQLGSAENDPSQAVLQNIAKDMRPSSLTSLPRSAVAGLAEGGNALINVPHNFISNKIPAHESNFNYMQGVGVSNPSGIDKLTASLAESAPYVAGGEALAAAGGGGLLARILGQGASNAAGGAINNPEHPFASALVGGVLGGGGSALTDIPGLKQGANDLIESLMSNRISKFPLQQATNDILHDLSAGAENVEEANQLNAANIHQKYNEHLQKTAEYINPAKSDPRLQNLYPGVNAYDNASDYIAPPGWSGARPRGSKIDDFGLEGVKGDIGKSYDTFKNDTSFENLHNLSQEVGSEVGALKKQFNKTPEEREQLRQLQESYGKINQRIDSQLERLAPDQAENVRQGRKYFEENVLPYRSYKQLRDIAEGRETNPNNLTSIFKSPSDIKSKEGILRIGDIKKVYNDQSEDFGKRLIYSQIKGHENAGDSNAVIRSLDRARGSGGLGQYEPFYLSDALDAMKEGQKTNKFLEDRTEKNKQRLNTIAKVGIGSAGLGSLYELIRKLV